MFPVSFLCHYFFVVLFFISISHIIYLFSHSSFHQSTHHLSSIFPSTH
jgi:hypothetical protein